MDFSDKLPLYRKRAGLSQSELCEFLNITRQTLFKWEHGYNYPSLGKLARLCQALNCDAQDLIGESDYNEHAAYSHPLPRSVRSSVIGENIRHLRIRCGISQQAMCRALCVSRQTLSRWEHARITPDTANLSALAVFFGLSIHELLYANCGD